MKIKTLSVILMVLVTGLTSCFDESNFPDEPRITFNDVIFKDIGDNNDADSLILFIDFEDGDGDLGLDPDENAPPYALRNYFNNRTGAIFNFNTDTFAEITKFSDRATNPDLPELNDVTACLNWDLAPDLFFSDGTPVEDTLFFEFNPRHNTILVDFFIQENGEFREFDFRLEGDCSVTFDGRFPILVDDNNRGALEGTIRYRMPSQFFKAILGADTPLRLEATIIDRSGNFSNTVTTGDFTLNGIRVN